MTDDILDRLRRRNAGTTHWEGCDAVHDLCAAVREIERLRAERDGSRVTPGAGGPGIALWRWDDAPRPLRELSTHGGDEDWVAWVPEGVEPPDAWRADRDDRGWTPGLGWLRVYPAPGGCVLVWAHA